MVGYLLGRPGIFTTELRYLLYTITKLALNFGHIKISIPFCSCIFTLLSKRNIWDFKRQSKSYNWPLEHSIPISHTVCSAVLISSPLTWTWSLLERSHIEKLPTDTNILSIILCVCVCVCCVFVQKVSSHVKWKNRDIYWRRYKKPCT